MVPVIICLVSYAALHRHAVVAPGVPKATIFGKSYRHEVILYQPISPQVTADIRRHFAEKLAIVPFTYRNIMNFPSPDMKFRYWFQILYLDIDRLRPFLPDLAEGRYPARDRREAVIGYQSARQWDLALGDIFTYDPTRYVFDYYRPDTRSRHRYRVVGILARNIPFDLLGGSLIVPPPDPIEEKRLFLPPNGLFIYPLRGAPAMDEMNAVFYEQHLAPLFSRRGWTELSMINLIAVFGLGIVILNLFVAGSAHVDHNLHNIGLLKAFGMDDSQVVTIFAAGLVLLESIGFLLGAGVAKLIVHILNRAYSKPFDYVYAYYQIPMAAYALVLGILSLLVVASNVYVVRKINRLAPGELLI